MIPDWTAGDDRRLAEYRGETVDDDRPADETCALCGGPIVDFRDRLSREEFQITGACQACQDDVFGDVIVRAQ